MFHTDPPYFFFIVPDNPWRGEMMVAKSQYTQNEADNWLESYKYINY
ncbi:hypothetical protein BLGI_1393 [Brevibacillus laterosporus GI-9]|nr:hypothetical protein BLGI_1393 [Brevibacillus laterosporus GI-9]